MAKPNLALIPAAQGSKLFSVLPSSGVGDFDFSRSGKATRINSQGLIEEVANGQSRLNYPMIDGKVVGCPHHILEPQRTQLIQYSEDFSNVAWSKSSTGINTSVGTNGINPNVAISPDGTLNADRVNFILQADLDAGLFDIFAASQNNTYLASVFLKGEGSNIGKAISIRIKRLSGGTFTSVDTKYTLTDKWVRLEIDPLTMPSGSTNGIISFTSSQATNCLIYGCQVEQGSYPTSYIPNYGTGSGVTRSAETANDSGDAATFNDSEGVLMAEIAYLKDRGTSSPFKVERISISNATDTNRLFISNTTIANQIQVFVRNSTGISFNKTVTISDNTLYNKIVLKYKANDFSLWINGFELELDNTYSYLPSGLNVLKFEGASGSYDFFGNTKQLQYYNSALTDSELEQLTSWTSFTDMAQGQLYTIK